MTKFAQLVNEVLLVPNSKHRIKTTHIDFLSYHTDSFYISFYLAKEKLKRLKLCRNVEKNATEK